MDIRIRQTVTSLLDGVIAIIENKNEDNTHLEVVSPIPGSYNPAKFGVAYYFSGHGKKVQNVRTFSIDVERSTAGFDNKPDQLCNKMCLPQKWGFLIVFWFCPLH